MDKACTIFPWVRKESARSICPLSKPVEAKPRNAELKSSRARTNFCVRRDKRGIQPKVQAAVTVLLEVNARFPTALGE